MFWEFASCIWVGLCAGFLAFIGLIRLDLKDPTYPANSYCLIRVATHEAGHALIAELSPSFLNWEANVIPDKENLGCVHSYWTYPEQLYERIVLALGGAAAEIVCFNKVFAGSCGPDLEQALVLARRVPIDEVVEPTSNPRSRKFVASLYKVPPDPHALTVLTAAYEEAKTRIKSSFNVFEVIRDALFQTKTLTSEEFAALLKTK